MRWYLWVQKPHLVFAVLATFFGIFSAVLVPQLTVNDENMHFLRAYSLASGSLGNKGCTYPHDINIKAGSVYTGETDANFGQKINSSDIRGASCGSAAGYSPIMHLPQSIGIFIAKITHPSSALMILLGRLVNLAFYVIALYFVIKYVRIGKWSFVVIALLPSMVHLAASLSGDVINNVIVLSMIALILNLFTQTRKLSKQQVAITAALAVTLSLTKVTNILLLVPLLFLPASLFIKNKHKQVPFSICKWATIGGIGGVSAIAILGWQRIFGSPLVNQPLENPLMSNPLRFIEVLVNTYVSPFIGYTDLVLRGIVGEFASFQYHLPTFMVIMLFCLLFITLLHTNSFEERVIRPRIGTLVAVSTGVLLALVIVVSYALYTAWAIQPFRLGPGALYADGVQGRYFTAFLALLIPLFIWLRKYININTKSAATLPVVVFILSTIALSYYTIETYLFVT